jgi:hypothetical protein
MPEVTSLQQVARSQLQGRLALTQGMRRGLTQQMSRLRARLWPYDLDFLCLNSYGYLLLSRSNEQVEVR